MLPLYCIVKSLGKVVSKIIDNGFAVVEPAFYAVSDRFKQFHPTGMIWPPSVEGILVTEGVRGEVPSDRDRAEVGS